MVAYKQNKDHRLQQKTMVHCHRKEMAFSIDCNLYPMFNIQSSKYITLMIYSPFLFLHHSRKGDWYARGIIHCHEA